MKSNVGIPDERLGFHTSQIRVIGPDGQRRLRNSRVIVFGTGRIGAPTVIALHAAGIGSIECVDPQTIEAEQLGPFFFAERADLGNPKAATLARFLNRRRMGFVRGIHAGVEQVTIQQIRNASLVISCANTITARLSAERKAILAGVPVIQVAAFDGRDQLGGMITLRHPAAPHFACYGCISAAEDQTRNRSDGLLTPVTAVLGNLAAEIATLLLVGLRDRTFREHNVFILDLERLVPERITVLRRGTCRVCSSNAAA